MQNLGGSIQQVLLVKGFWQQIDLGFEVGWKVCLNNEVHVCVLKDLFHSWPVFLVELEHRLHKEVNFL